MIKVLSIDASTTHTGYAVFKILNDGSFQKVDGGVFCPEELSEYKAILKKPRKMRGAKVSKAAEKTAAKERRHKAMAFRCNYMIEELNKICYKHKIKVIVMEDTYASKDMEAYKWLSRLQGSMIGYTLHNDGNITFFHPSHWRKVLDIPMMNGNTHLERQKLKELSLKNYRERFDGDVPEDEAEATLIGLAYICEKDVV